MRVRVARARARRSARASREAGSVSAPNALSAAVGTTRVSGRLRRCEWSARFIPLSMRNSDWPSVDFSSGRRCRTIEWERQGYVDPEFFLRMGELGFWGCRCPRSSVDRVSSRTSTTQLSTRRPQLPGSVWGRSHAPRSRLPIPAEVRRRRAEKAVAPGFRQR